MTSILIIEDDKLIRWSLKEIFLKEGYTVDSAADSNSALESIRKNNYQIIFIDLEVDDFSPAEMIAHLRRHQPESALIVLSAMNKQEVEQIIRGENIFAVMDKPFQTDAVKRVVKKAIEQCMDRDRRGKR